MSIRIATYNLNNLFDRASLFQLEGFSKEAGRVLQDVQTLSELLESESYAAGIGEKIVALLTTYGFNSNKEKRWFTINEIRNKLFKLRKSDKKIELVAKGRGSWLGWVELARENVNEESTKNTARVIKAVGADILCTVEVENRLTLDRFNKSLLREFGNEYTHTMLIDGNDPRGIDIGLLSQYPIHSMRSHIDDAFKAANGKSFPIFSRDCAEYEILLPGGTWLWMICNHLKSKGYGNPKANDTKRLRQATRIKEIVNRFDLAKDYVVIAGDFNDTPDRKPLEPLVKTAKLFDVLASPLLKGPRWTYQTGNEQIDYLLVSEALYKKLTLVHVERRGIYSKSKFNGLFDHFPEVTDKVTQASDHAAVWAEFSIP